jgi:uncharacterized repeat protein (TIGR02543 family)
MKTKTIFSMMFGIMLVCSVLCIGCGDGAGGDTYTVTFDSNGGSEVAAISGIPSGTTITLPTPPTKGTDEFDGWFKDDGIWQNEFTGSTPVTADITVYAKWTTIDPLDGTSWSKEVTENVNGQSETYNITLTFNKPNVVFSDDSSDPSNVSGTYVVTNNTVTFLGDIADLVTGDGTISDDTLTVNSVMGELTFSKNP